MTWLQASAHRNHLLKAQVLENGGMAGNSIQQMWQQGFLKIFLCESCRHRLSAETLQLLVKVGFGLAQVRLLLPG